MNIFKRLKNLWVLSGFKYGKPEKGILYTTTDEEKISVFNPLRRDAQIIDLTPDVEIND